MNLALLLLCQKSRGVMPKVKVAVCLGAPGFRGTMTKGVRAKGGET